MIRKQTLNAWEHSRNIFSREKSNRCLRKSIQLQNVKSTIEERHILLTPNKEHEKLFPKVPVVGF